VDINEHLLYVEGGTQISFVPAFTKGIITILPPPGPDSVTVSSMTVNTGATGVSIPILIDNGATLSSLEVPLVIREVTPGSYITALTMSCGDRLPEPGQPLGDIIIKYEHPVPDGTCKPGGFATVGGLDFVSPDAVTFARLGIFPPNYLPPGNDVTGSLLLTVNVTSTPGTFEIDTTCTGAGTNLMFGSDMGIPILPVFTKGVITITPPCLCPYQADFDGDGFITPLDLSSMIDILFAGLADIKDPDCPTSRSDFDCDGFATPLDLSSLIDHLFAGGRGPCDPCLCIPVFPDDCPPFP
jgi:hypothetical protein